VILHPRSPRHKKNEEVTDDEKHRALTNDLVGKNRNNENSASSPGPTWWSSAGTDLAPGLDREMNRATP